MMQDSSWITLFPGVAARLLRAEGHERSLVLLLAVVVGGLPSLTAAQQYKSAQVNERLRLDTISAQRFAAGPATDPVERQKFDAYFTEYLFPVMTHPEPEHLAELGTRRQELFSRVLWPAQSPELQADLTDKAFKAMVPIVKDRGYHPAVQYNAILVIGLLDAEYAVDVGAGRRPPKPLPLANKLLVAAVDAAAQGKPLAPHLVVGALVGLERHAKYQESLPPEDIAATKAAVLKLLGAKDSSPNLDSDVAAWIKLKAGSVLAELGSAGEANDVHLALMNLVGDDSLNLDDRCQAAALIGELSYEGAKLDAKTTIVPLVQLSSQVARSEAKRAQEVRDFYASGGRPSGRQGRRSGRGGSSGDDDLKFDRRQLLSRIVALSGALKAVKTALPADEQTQVDALLAAFAPVELSAANKDTVVLQLVSEIQEMATQIDNVAKPGAALSDEGAFANEL